MTQREHAGGLWSSHVTQLAPSAKVKVTQNTPRVMGGITLVLYYCTGDGSSTNFDFRMAFLYYQVWVLLSETTTRRTVQIIREIDAPMYLPMRF